MRIPGSSTFRVPDKERFRDGARDSCTRTGPVESNAVATPPRGHGAARAALQAG